jgi:hypothetical protein
MKRLEKKLEDLLLQKRFEELGSEDRDWVLAQISTEEYGAMRQALLESKLAFRSDQAYLDPNIQNTLRKKVLQNKQQNPTSKIFRYSIPAWQAVVAACVLFLLFANFKSKFVAPKETIYVHLTDTVYRDLPAQFVDSTFGTQPDTNAQVISNTTKRINQSPRQGYFKSNSEKKNYDTLQVNLLDLNNSFATTYDTSVLNSMINNYLKSPADKRKRSIDKAALDLIERVY